MSGFDDFDFMIGDWDIANERLVGRLVGSDTWETFPATSRVEKVMPIPAGPNAGGHGGNLDTMFVPERGFTGMTLRLFNPDTAEWSIYWSDTKSHKLFPAVVGRFDNGRGVFFSDDMEGDIPVRVRFDWIAGNSPEWRQSFSTDGEQTWELNWIMRFSRPAA